MVQNSTKAEPRSKKSIKKIVDEFRIYHGVNIYKEVDVIKLLDLIAVNSICDYEILDDDELSDSIYAETDLVQKKIFIKKSIFEAAVNGNERHRFTLAHEIGHVILHTNKIIVCRTLENIKSYEDPEWQANQFAAELLAPIACMKNLSIAEIMEKYKVSKKVATYRKRATL